MHLKIFTDENKLEEYLKILKYSLGRSGEITERLRREIQDGLIYTKNLPSDFQINASSWILYALYDKEEVVGTITLSEDRHVSDTAQVEYFALKPEYRKKGWGLFMMDKMRKEIAAHSSFKTLILATGKGAGTMIYERYGMTHVGKICFDGRERHFFIWPVVEHKI